MQIKPILTALRHHKAGTVLIVVQIALTLAIVCNALFIIHQRVAQLSQPSGLEEANLIRIQNQWVGKADDKAYGSLMATDLATLRRLPGVADAYATNSVPLSGGGWSMSLRLKADQSAPSAQTAIYFSDDHTLSTLGLKLVAGRNFRADDIRPMSAKDDLLHPAVIIVTRTLADKLFPTSTAVGKTVYLANHVSTIIGVVERMQTPWLGMSWGSAASTLVPFRLLTDGTNYVIRTQPGQLDRVRRSAPEALFAQNRMRVIPDQHGVETFRQIRADAYASDRGMAILMAVICVMLLAITAAGIVGLTSFWVGQRRKQIGVRRALGATRGDILSYFLTENLLIGMGGVLLGIALAIGLNLWMVTRFEMQHLSLWYVLAGAVALLLLGQGAVLAPALRASRVPPVEATRSV
ncbi:MAG: FtsX-like permease family protein [Rhodanobacter sp.]|nr:MAG: FtsX-like permease family protein [Rhodanobacter sp.]TAM41474.1 MAG: FtsX-like permease family protein [Rhodanobacter sp.]TAN29393.1 MAG: FtsX-like permease family protein [Rhodanobacter sp.]